MTTTQKIIKYVAIALAISIIASICAFFVHTFSILSNIFDTEDILLTENKMFVVENDISNIDIDLSVSNLIIEESSTGFRVETNNKNVSVKETNDTLNIKDNTKKNINVKSKSEVILYIPKGSEFKSFKLSSAVGRIKVDKVNADNIVFELGVGQTDIDNIIASKSVNIDSGVGEVSISSGTINDLDLNSGVGEVNITASILGNSSVESGIGSLNINLAGEKEEYKFDIEKGVGNVIIDGETVHSDEVYGNGENTISIDSGIGEVKVRFSND